MIHGVQTNLFQTDNYVIQSLANGYISSKCFRVPITDPLIGRHYRVPRHSNCAGYAVMQMHIFLIKTE